MSGGDQEWRLRRGSTRNRGAARWSPTSAFASVTKRFDDVAAVDDVSLEIPRGSFFALLARLWEDDEPGG